MRLYFNGNNKRLGELEFALGASYLSLYDKTGKDDAQKLLALKSSIGKLLSNVNLPIYIDNTNAEIYYSELKRIQNYLDSRSHKAN